VLFEAKGGEKERKWEGNSRRVKKKGGKRWRKKWRLEEWEGGGYFIEVRELRRWSAVMR